MRPDLVFVIGHQKMNAAIVFVLGLLVSGVVSSEWNYADQSKWPKLCNSGKSQSPVNLDGAGAAEKSFDQFVFRDYDLDFEGSVKNNGHTVAVKLTNSNSPPKLNGGGLSKEYTLDHLHFHWGSEHTLNDFRFPLEIHLVHFASEYGNISSALGHSDGIAVLGVFCDLSPDEDVHFQPLVKVMENVTDLPHSSNKIEEVNAYQFLPRDTAGFYRYSGSLTTPGCDEVVTWTVFTNTVPISRKQVRNFEVVHSDKDSVLSKNFRSVQNLNGRQIYLKRSPLPHAEDSETTKQRSGGGQEEKESKTKKTGCNCYNSSPFSVVYSFVLQLCLLVFLKSF